MTEPRALDYDAVLEDLTPAEALEVLMGAAIAEATAHPRCFDCGTAHDPDPDACPKAEWQATP